MSSNQAPVEIAVIPRTRDLGDGFTVRRALPTVERRMVGPFVFFDQMGPAVFTEGHGLDVRPHPHIGLATITYVFEGEILHRDSLGSVQPIRPGEVNWMTAGRGIAHSERTAPELRKEGGKLFGIQAWIALPREQEEVEPAFVHHDRSALPVLEGEGREVRLIAGELFGARSPVKTHSPLFYADVVLGLGSTLAIDPTWDERAAYVVEGEIELGGHRFGSGQLLVFRPKQQTILKATVAARLMLLGGESMDGPRHIYWNFVSSSRDRIEQAKDDWRNGRFGKVPGDEKERIPLPDEPLAERPVNYP
jgi:redox-sensitive bicupin YhaK (pirin superfamily)